MNKAMKRYTILVLIILLAACEKDRDPMSPGSSKSAVIQIIIENNTSSKSSSDTSSVLEKAARPAVINQCEVRVLRSDNSQVASKVLDAADGRFSGTIKVKAEDNLKVLCIGTNNGVVERFGIDDDVDTKPGKTTTALITGWDTRYIPEITGISPNPSTDGSYTVTWNTAPNASSYVLQEADNQQFSGAVASYSTPELQLSLSGKIAGTYYYQVQASNEYNIKSGWCVIDSAVVQNTHTISGTISGADGVTVTLIGDATEIQIVNDGDAYSFTVAEGGSYTVKPLKPGYSFTPPNQTYNNVTSSHTRDFSGAQDSYTISGTVTGADGMMVILGGDASDSKTVDNGGTYSFTVGGGGSYTVTPFKTGYLFNPASSSFFEITSNQTQNFTGISSITYTISGTVSGADDVTITLGGDASGSLVIDDGGSYSFTVAEGGNYTVIPSKSGYTFTPASGTFNNVTADQIQNFTSIHITYTISGKVSGADGVTVTLSGDDSGSQVVNDGGSYSFTVAEGGNYSITPTKTGYTFNPISKTFNNVTSNQTQNFAAIKNTYTISGIVSGTDDVTVTLSGDKEQSITVDDGGTYSFTVEYGGDYTVTPSKTGLTFSPASQTFNNVTSNQSQNFVAEAVLTERPAPPSNLKATVISSSSISLTWQDNSNNEAGFKIWRSLNGSNFIWVTDVVLNTDSYTDTGLSSGTTYYYKVTAFNADGQSQPSNRAEASTTQNGKIAFESYRYDNAEIYVMDTDGSNQRNLTNHPDSDRSPSWSPDGSQIAFYSNRDDNFEIYVMDADGSNQRNLTNHPDSDTYPSWSSDGSQIAFGSLRDGNYEIYVMDADGSNQRNLTNHPVTDRVPSWSPDSSKIAFYSKRDGNYEIYVMDADGSNQRNLTNHPDSDAIPSWSPDGSQISFSSNRDGNTEIYVMDADGSNQTRLTNNPDMDSVPSWSPDGSKIAFTSKRDGNYEIYVMDADGSNQHNLTNHPNIDLNPSWSPF